MILRCSSDARYMDLSEDVRRRLGHHFSVKASVFVPEPPHSGIMYSCNYLGEDCSDPM